MDYGVPEQNGAVYGEEEPQYEGHYEEGEGNYNIDGSAGIKHDSSSSSSAGKLFVGGIAWETSEDSFNRYFRKYGEITDSVIMLDKMSGRPRGFGFITFADPEVAERVIQEDHVIDGRSVEVKRTVPREDMQSRGGMSKTKKIFVGGLPLSLKEDDMREYFSSYGNIVDHQIMLDQTNGRSRGFGFVTFENEDAVEKILSDGQMHEIGGKHVEIKRAEPKRSGFDHSFDSRVRRGAGSSYKSSGNFAGVPESFDGGYGGGKMGRGSGGYGGYGNYGGYGSFGGSYPGGAAGFYGGYGGYGYGYGFGGPMYNGGAYGGGGFGYGGTAGYGVGKGYGGPDGGYESYDGGKGFGGGGSGGGYGPAKGYGGAGGEYGPGKGYGGSGGGGYGGGKGYGNANAGGRFHPYRK